MARFAQAHQLQVLVNSMTDKDKAAFRRIVSMRLRHVSHLYEVVDLPNTFAPKELTTLVARNFKREDISDLYTVLLDFLSADMDPQDRVNANIRYINALMDREQYESCMTLFRQSYDLAVRNELLESLNTLLQLQMRLIIRNIDTESNMESVKVALIEVKEKLANFYQYDLLYLKVFPLSYSKINRAKCAARLRSFIDHPLIEDESKALSVRANIFLYLIRQVIFSKLGEFEKAYEAEHKLVELYETHDFLVREDISAYIGMMNNLIYAKISKKEYTGALVNIDKLQSLITVYPNRLTSELVDEIKLRTFCQYARIYSMQGKYENILDEVSPIEEIVQKEVGSSMMILFRQVAVMHIALANYHLGAFDTATHWTQQLFEIRHESIGIDVQITGLIIKMLICFDHCSEINLQNCIGIAKRYLKKHKVQSKFEALFLDMADTIAVELSPIKRQKIYCDSLRIFEAIAADTNERSVYSLLVIDWLRKKLGKPEPVKMFG